MGVMQIKLCFFCIDNMMLTIQHIGKTWRHIQKHIFMIRRACNIFGKIKMKLKRKELIKRKKSTTRKLMKEKRKKNMKNKSMIFLKKERRKKNPRKNMKNKSMIFLKKERRKNLAREDTRLPFLLKELL